MLYDLVRTMKGKKLVVMTDTRAKVDTQHRKFKISQNGKVGGHRVSYDVVESSETKSYKRPPTDKRRWQ